MTTLQARGWSAPEATWHKFLGSLIAHSLSQKISRKEYEVVNESYIDINNMDSDTVDVIVYNMNSNFAPEMIIEFCSTQELKSTLNSIEIISDLYQVREAFVFNTETFTWYKINGEERDKNSISKLFHFDLNELLKTSFSKYAA